MTSDVLYLRSAVEDVAAGVVGVAEERRFRCDSVGTSRAGNPETTYARVLSDGSRSGDDR
jgi:hypothetical protein